MSETDLNASIDAAWHDLQPMLVRYDGTAARDLLLELEDDRVWSACYWRAEHWLRSWFQSRDPRSTTPDDPGHSFALECFVNFLAALWPERNPPHWKTADLPALLSKLREHGNDLHRQRYPSREVHS
jgi:hypothetical protein